MKAQIFNLANYGNIIEDRWKQFPAQPKTVYTTIACLRDCAQSMVMAPDTLKFLVATMDDVHPGTLVEMGPDGQVKWMTEDA